MCISISSSSLFIWEYVLTDPCVFCYFSIYITLQLSKPEQKLEANAEIREQMLENSSRCLRLLAVFIISSFIIIFATSNVYKLLETVFYLEINFDNFWLGVNYILI